MRKILVVLAVLVAGCSAGATEGEDTKPSPSTTLVATGHDASGGWMTETLPAGPTQPG